MNYYSTNKKKLLAPLCAIVLIAIPSNIFAAGYSFREIFAEAALTTLKAAWNLRPIRLAAAGAAGMAAGGAGIYGATRIAPGAIAAGRDAANNAISRVGQAMTMGHAAGRDAANNAISRVGQVMTMGHDALVMAKETVDLLVDEGETAITNAMTRGNDAVNAVLAVPGAAAHTEHAAAAGVKAFAEMVAGKAGVAVVTGAGESIVFMTDSATIKAAADNLGLAAATKPVIDAACAGTKVSGIEAGMAAMRRVGKLPQTIKAALTKVGDYADSMTVARFAREGWKKGDTYSTLQAKLRQYENFKENNKATRNVAEFLNDVDLVHQYAQENDLAKKVSESKPGRLAQWLWNNPVSTTLRTNSALQKTIAAAFAANLIRDHYHYYRVLNTESIERMTPRARASNSMTNRAGTLVRMLHSFNGNENNTKAVQEKLKELRATLFYDISVGQVTIRDRFTDQVINVEKEGYARALDEANIAYTIDDEMKEVQSVIDLTDTYNYEIDIAEDVYQRGFKYDFGEACKAVPVGKGTQYYDYNTAQAAKLDAGMKEEEGLWKALRVSKYNIPIAVYPSRLPYYMQPSRWIISYAMPFTYKRAKRTWWSYTKKKWFLDSIRKLILVDPRRNDVGPSILV